jgi:hypothetical protein
MRIVIFPMTRAAVDQITPLSPRFLEVSNEREELVTVARAEVGPVARANL